MGRHHQYVLTGPSPRAWGSHLYDQLANITPGSIPTCVGLTCQTRVSLCPDPGPSPRAWGSRKALAGAMRRPRSIPTCVGLTRPARLRDPAAPVHPHVRGAHGNRMTPTEAVAGPSPRAWGSLTERSLKNLRTRSIPTCVGLTGSSACTRCWRSVHPHVRGAHIVAVNPCSSVVGPSPRAWGSLNSTDSAATIDRSIPTCVGLTSTAALVWSSTRVHPHVRGAHTYPDRLSRASPGPSPRAWGSRRGPGAGIPSRGSIPTCVGLTVQQVRAVAGKPVHPHVRGAHGIPARATGRPGGPSPRAWGSHRRSQPVQQRRRSIPTCVGLTQSHVLR